MLAPYILRHSNGPWLPPAEGRERFCALLACSGCLFSGEPLVIHPHVVSGKIRPLLYGTVIVDHVTSGGPDEKDCNEQKKRALKHVEEKEIILRTLVCKVSMKAN